MGPLPNGRTPWLVNGGDPNHLLIGVILQVPSLKLTAMLQLKMDGWKTFSFPFGAKRPNFRGELFVSGSVHTQHLTK